MKSFATYGKNVIKVGAKKIVGSAFGEIIFIYAADRKKIGTRKKNEEKNLGKKMGKWGFTPYTPPPIFD